MSGPGFGSWEELGTEADLVVPWSRAGRGPRGDLGDPPCPSLRPVLLLELTFPSCSPTHCSEPSRAAARPSPCAYPFHGPHPPGPARPRRADPRHRRPGPHRCPRRRPRPRAPLVPAAVRRPVRRRLADQLGDRAGHRAARPRGLPRRADRRVRRAAGGALGARGARPAHATTAGGQGCVVRARPCARRRQHPAGARRERARVLSAADRDVVLRRRGAGDLRRTRTVLTTGGEA